jgi:hypothetical protein
MLPQIARDKENRHLSPLVKAMNRVLETRVTAVGDLPVVLQAGADHLADPPEEVAAVADPVEESKSTTQPYYEKTISNNPCHGGNG